MAKIVKRTINFNPSGAADVTGYKLYWSVDSPVDYTSANASVGNKTTIIIPDDVPAFPLVEAQVNIGITAIDDIGNESDMVTATAPFDFDAPGAPTNLVVGTL